MEPGPTDLSYDEDIGHGSDDQGLQNPDQSGSVSQSTEHLELANAGEATYGELVQDALDQDYAHQAMGAGPIIVPGITQGTPVAQPVPRIHAPAQAPVQMCIPVQPAQLHMPAQAPAQIYMQAQAPTQIHVQVQAPAQINYPAVTRGLPNADHEINMIDNLRQHIRESLSGIPHNLPELKGIHAKLPEAYGGEDDFDHLDNWL
jgi:hypothetical protein